MREEAWAQAMREFYAALEAELAGAGAACRGCGECCRFDRVDHVLYASGMERRYLLLCSPVPNTGGEEPDLLGKGLRCPYQAGNACLAREGRALGCRLHFCAWPEGLEEAFAERWHERLKALHDSLGEAWDYRPLLPL